MNATFVQNFHPEQLNKLVEEDDGADLQSASTFYCSDSYDSSLSVLTVLRFCLQTMCQTLWITSRRHPSSSVLSTARGFSWSLGIYHSF